MKTANDTSNLATNSALIVHLCDAIPFCFCLSSPYLGLPCLLGFIFGSFSKHLGCNHGLGLKKSLRCFLLSLMCLPFGGFWAWAQGTVGTVCGLRWGCTPILAGDLSHGSCPSRILGCFSSRAWNGLWPPCLCTVLFLKEPNVCPVRENRCPAPKGSLS